MSKENNVNVVGETTDSAGIVDTVEETTPNVENAETLHNSDVTQSEESCHANLDLTKNETPEVTSDEIERTAKAVESEQRKKESMRPIKIMFAVSIVIIIILAIILACLILLGDPENVATIRKFTVNSFKLLSC